MCSLRISLFGRLHVEAEGKPLMGALDARKVQELLGYLLLHRYRSHPREELADVLWGENSGPQARKYLRQALWQLQTALKSEGEPDGGGVLLSDSEWVGINSQADIWTDVGQFEEAYSQVQGLPGQEIDQDRAREVAEAVELHQDGLLQGWYQDWCLFERERLQNMYLAMLNKLMTFFEAQGQYEVGLLYGHRILRLDRAHERTHWRMMRLHYLAGDRTSALRQYEKCAEALDEELGVKPARWTTALYEQVRSDNLPSGPVPSLPGQGAEASQAVPASDGYLDRLQAILNEFRQELQRYIQATEPAHRE